jgi:PAS domain S-box-containing protein
MKARIKASAPAEVASLARDFNAMTDALAAKAQEYIDTTNLTGVIIMRVDKDNRVSLVNDVMCEFLGSSREEILGTPILDYLHPEDALSTIRAIRKMVLSKGLVTGIVSRHVTPTGTRVTEWNGYPIFDEDGRYAGVHGAGRNISEHWRAEEALRESEEHYRELTDSITDVFFAVDGDLKYTYWNKASEKLTGISAQDAIGKSLYELFPEVKGTKADKLYLEVLRTQQPRNFVNQYRLGGKDFFFEISAYPSRTGLSVFVKDISERKRAQDALRRQEHELAERGKELNCLYGISVLVDKPGISLQEILQGTADLIPAAWQYPQVTCARIIVDGQEFRTANFKETAWRQASNITVSGQRAGSVEVYYLDKRPESDEGPFLKEERTLINAVGERLGHISERKRAQEALRESEEKYRRLVQDSIDGILVAQGLEIRFVNPALLKMLGCESEEEMVGRPFTDFVSPEYRKLMAERAYAREQGQDEPDRYEFKALRKDGSEVCAEISASRITYEGRVARQAIVRDISERKRAEEALREAKEFSDGLITSMQDGLSVLDSRGVHVDVNPAFCEMTGFSREELIGVGPPHPYWPPEAHKEIEMAFQKTLRDEFDDVELTFMRKNGERFPVIVSPSSLKDNQGNVISYFGTVKDITQRKRAEEVLRESEQRFRSLSTSAPIGVFLTDLRGRCVYANPRLQAISGLTLEQSLGYDWSKAIHPDDRAAVAEAAEKATRRFREFSYEFRIATPEGELRWARVHTSPMFSAQGEQMGRVGTLEDISERKRAEEALRESEARYRLLAENATDVIWTMDTNLRFTYMSPSVTRLRGYTVEEAMAQTLAETLTPASLEVAMRTVAEEWAIEKMEDKDLTRWRTLEVENTCKDGSTVWFEVGTAFLHDEDKLPVGIVGISRDISKRKRAEEALQKIREDLESRAERRMWRGSPYGLTFRELTVLHLVAAGESDKEIAAVLGITTLTASKHLTNILHKMGAASRTEAGVRAVREGLLDQRAGSPPRPGDAKESVRIYLALGMDCNEAL